MYCTKCGKQLPDDANFCLQCGQSTVNYKGQVVNIPNRPVELLQIDSDIKRQDKRGFFSFDIIQYIKYYAKVGKKVIDETEWANITDRDRDSGLTEMVARLIAQGWQVMTTDQQGRVRTMSR